VLSLPQFFCVLFCGAFVLCGAARAGTGTPTEPLTEASEVLSLSAEQAGRRLRVTVTGVVTAAEPDWRGQFFVQDATGGIFVENLNRVPPAPGDLVVVDGVTHPGAFAPIISAPTWRKLGTTPLPEPKRVAIEDLKAGHEDSQRIEIIGVVRTARLQNNRLLVDLSVAGNRLQVTTPVSAEASPASFVAARVRVRGTAAMHYIGALRHLTAAAVYVPCAEDFAVLESEQVDPFEGPIMPVNSIAQYRRGRHAEQRVHVRGNVTFQRPGEELFLQDSSGGLRIATEQPGKFALGEEVEAVGFVEYDGHLPVLRDAVLRRCRAPHVIVPARTVPFLEIARGEHHGETLTLRGRLLDRSTRPHTRPDGRAAGFVTTWLVQGSGTMFTIEHLSAEESTALAEIPIGSVVEADGVCVSTINAAAKLTSLMLLLPDLDHLRVIEKPSWLTPARLLAGLALLSAGLVIVVAWLLTVAKKNAALRRVVRELEHAQRELQEAHDTLEEKVAERSAQLQVEMTARKTAEVQFKAVLAERTRLARDLHDTLEQTLAGIAMRLNTAAKLSRRDPEASDTHLQLARNWLHQSQVGLRRSIWDLRSRELEQFDLASALKCSADQMVHGTEIALDFETKGQAQGLPEVVEENVLRIGQEALTNIAKHAHATRVSIRLEFDPRVLRLRVEDDGAGFDASATPGEGHFGLTGMAERAKRLAGGITVTSAPDRGTTIVVEVPLEPTDAPAAKEKLDPAV
jgi:signal transduction histidine kinase